MGGLGESGREVVVGGAGFGPLRCTGQQAA